MRPVYTLIPNARLNGQGGCIETWRPAGGVRRANRTAQQNYRHDAGGDNGQRGQRALFEQVILETENDNDQAIRIYQSFGFKPVASVVSYVRADT